MIVVTIICTLYFFYTGLSYYNLPLEERFFHQQHEWLKPSGIYGQGLGVIGTFLIFFGVLIYILRKRYGFLSNLIRIKYLLEFHIFLCTLGSIMILFHTSFKFGGIVSIAFWSMTAVVLSGIIGRFIYNQIPKTIEGRAMSLKEIQQERVNIYKILTNDFGFESELAAKILQATSVRDFKQKLLKTNITARNRKKIVMAFKQEKSLEKKISRLETMQRMFKYWHVIHMPFALIMLVIVIIHIGVAITFGYKWIF